MKNKILTLTIICLVLTGKIIGQNLKGIWLSSHTLKISKKHISYTPDSILNKAYLLLDFSDNKNLIFKSLLGSEQKFGKYSIKNKNIQIEIGNELIKGKILENELILTLKDTVEYVNKMYLKRITPSDLKNTQIPNKLFFFNTSWSIKSESDSKNFGMKLNFLNKDSLDSFNENVLFITKNKGLDGYTEFGNYNINFYKNHFFLYILNRGLLEESIYHFYKIKKNIFYTDTFENSYSLTNPPKLKRIKFEKINYLTTQQIKYLKSELIGKWKAINNPIPFDSITSNYTKLENQSFELTFKENNEFEIKMSGTLVSKSIRLPKKIVVNGKWKISKTGNYLYIKQNGGGPSSITINELSKDSMNIYYYVKEFERSSNSYIKTFIKLIK